MWCDYINGYSYLYINIIDIHVKVCACCLSVPFTSINGIIHFLYYTGLSFLQMIVTAKFNGNTPSIAQVEVEMYVYICMHSKIPSKLLHMYSYIPVSFSIAIIFVHAC